MSDFKEFFSKNADSYANSQSHKKGEDLIQLIQALNPVVSDTAIDLASGTGFTAMELASRVSKVVAFDGTREMLEKAKALASERGIGNIEYVLGDVSELPYPESTFDIITCRRAAHHFTDKKKFLSELFRTLKKGGRMGLVDMAVPEAPRYRILEFFLKGTEEEILKREIAKIDGFRPVEVINLNPYSKANYLIRLKKF